MRSSEFFASVLLLLAHFIREKANIRRIVGMRGAAQVAAICIEITILNGYRSISSASERIYYFLPWTVLKYKIIVFVSSCGIFKAIIKFRVGV